MNSSCFKTVNVPFIDHLLILLQVDIAELTVYTNVFDNYQRYVLVLADMVVSKEKKQFPQKRIRSLIDLFSLILSLFCHANDQI